MNNDDETLLTLEEFLSKYPREVIKDKYAVVVYPNTQMEEILAYGDNKFEAYKYRKELNPKAKIIKADITTIVCEGLPIIYSYEAIE